MDMLWMKQGCGGCGASAPVWTDICPRCGQILHSARDMRKAGVLYLVLGSILTASAILLLSLITQMVLSPGDSGRFTGGALELAIVYGVLGFVLVLGVTGLWMGAWQVVYGRLNLKLVRVVIVLYVIFWVGAIVVMSLS